MAAKDVHPLRVALHLRNRRAVGTARRCAAGFALDSAQGDAMTVGDVAGAANPPCKKFPDPPDLLTRRRVLLGK